MEPKPTEKHYCRECGHEMDWSWSQGTGGSPGAWVVICRNVALDPAPETCLMAGEPFRHDNHTQERFAVRRAVRLIHRAHAGIISYDKAVDEWIAEAVRRGIVPENWQEAGTLAFSATV